MSFVSYAQNFEDVMLHRALNHVDHGFYIDVGAWSPDIDSVTRAFYELGWRGINVEPNPEFHGQLCAKRPRDINLKVAVSDHEAVLSMNFLGSSGLSTLDDHIAAKHLASGLAMERKDVQVTTLRALWREHVPLGQEVHFLKVDVEGAEKAVLDGNDWQQCRPWIVVVEATLPMEQTDSYAAWEPILLSAGYHFAYADGLNRYYVASERSDLKDSFCYPPNVFDGFVLSAQRNAEAQAAQARSRANEAEAQAQQAYARADAAVRALQPAAAQLQAIRNSFSWRITAPLRFVAGLFLHPGVTIRSVFNHILLRGIKVAQRPLARVMAFVLRRPHFSQRINRLLMRYPILHRQLLSVAHRQGVPSSAPTDLSGRNQPSISPTLVNMPPRARQIYSDLHRAVENRRKVR